MKLILLGTGTPTPSATRQCSANLVRVFTTNVLFDAGRGATTQLAKLGIHPRDIDFFFITHHHFDHIANLDDLLLAAWNGGRTTPIHVLGPHGTASIIDHLFKGIYCRDIEFRLKEAEVLGVKMPDIRDLIRVTELRPNSVFYGENWQVRVEEVEHGHALGLDHDAWPCFGYRIEAEGKSLAISGDTIDCPGVRRLAMNADLLLQCCYLSEAEVDDSTKRILSDYVLASARQASRIAKAASVKKMVLTHLAPKSDAMLETTLAEARYDFKGDVVLGEDLMSIYI